MSELTRLASIPMVSLKMFSILLNDSLEFLTHGSDLITHMLPVNEWFHDFYHRRHDAPLALLRNSAKFATDEITTLIRNVDSHVLNYANLEGSTVLSTWDTSVLYTFYVCRTTLGETPQAMYEEAVFDLCYEDINRAKFLEACTDRNRSLLTRTLAAADAAEALGVKKGMRLSDKQWSWLFVLASLIEQKNETHEKVRLILESAAVVRKAYETVVSQPRSQSSDRERHLSRVTQSMTGQRLQFD